MAEVQAKGPAVNGIMPVLTDALSTIEQNSRAPDPVPSTTGPHEVRHTPPSSVASGACSSSVPRATPTRPVANDVNSVAVAPTPVSSTATPSAGSSYDVIDIDSMPVLIKTEVMDNELQFATRAENSLENIDWFLEQVQGGYQECEFHQMDMLEKNLVCLSCQKLICALCLRDYHGRHDIISIAKLRECRSIKTSLEDDVSKLQLLQQTLAKEFDEKNHFRTQVEQSAQVLLTKVEKAFDHLADIVENKRQEIKKHIVDFEKQQVSELTKDLERIKSIEQTATLMIKRVMVFFTKLDILEARALPNMLAEVIASCREFRHVVRRPSLEHKEKQLPEKKFSKILPSLLAVTSICKTIHPEATKVVWSTSPPVAVRTPPSLPEDTKDPNMVKSCTIATSMLSEEEMEVETPPTPAPKKNPNLKFIVHTTLKDVHLKNHPLQKCPTDFDEYWQQAHTHQGRGRISKAAKRYSKDDSNTSTPEISPATTKKSRLESRTSSTTLLSSSKPNSSSTSSNPAGSPSSSSKPNSSSTSSKPAGFSSTSSKPNSSSVSSKPSPSTTSTPTTEPVSTATESSTMPVITNVVSLSQQSPNLELFHFIAKTKSANLSMESGLRKVMAVVPINQKQNSTSVKGTHAGRWPNLASRLYNAGSPSTLQSPSSVATTTSQTVITAADSPTLSSVSQPVVAASQMRSPARSTARSQSLTPGTSTSSSGREMSMSRDRSSAAASEASADSSCPEDSAVINDADGFPILPNIDFYPSTMVPGRMVMVRAPHNKIWLGVVSNTTNLKSNQYFLVQWLSGQLGVDTIFEVQEKWQRKSDKAHTDCLICHFKHDYKLTMSSKLMKDLKIATIKPHCSEKKRWEPPSSTRRSPKNPRPEPRPSPNARPSATPSASQAGSERTEDSPARSMRRGTSHGKSSKS